MVFGQYNFRMIIDDQLKGAVDQLKGIVDQLKSTVDLYRVLLICDI